MSNKQKLEFFEKRIKQEIKAAFIKKENKLYYDEKFNTQLFIQKTFNDEFGEVDEHVFFRTIKYWQTLFN